MTRRREVAAWSWVFGFTILAILIDCVAPPYTLRVLTIAGVYAIATIGYQLVFGQAGALSLAQGAFFGLGAYAAAIVETRDGISGCASLPLAIALPVFLGFCTGIITLRLRTHYFALATLLVSQIALLVATQWETLTGGANGIAGIPPLVFLGSVAAPRHAMFALTWLLVGAAAFLASLWIGPPRRGAWAILRAHPYAAPALGIDAAGLRLFALTASAGFAGLAGWLIVHVTPVVSPDLLGLPVMITILTAAVIGGVRAPAGAILGSVLIVGLPEWVRPLRDYYLIGDGALMLVCLWALPEGLAGFVQPLAPIPRAATRHPHGTASGALVLEAVTKSFGALRAIDDVSLRLEPGTVVGLVGPNGSGKSSLLNAISGLTPSTSGAIVYAGIDITRLAAHRIARIGVARTFQSPVLAGNISAAETVGLVTAIDPQSVLIRCGYAGDPDALAETLPFASCRHVELARALAASPGLMLLDEPASGLDAAERGRLSTILRSAAKEGAIVLVVEHDVPFLSAFCDRLICLSAGSVIADGPPASVTGDPAVIEAYLGVRPSNLVAAPPSPGFAADRT